MPAPEALSASQLQLYLTCSLKYRFQYIDRLPRLHVTANQVFGIAVHAALQWLHQQEQHGRTPPLSEVLRVFEADWYAQTELAPLAVRFDDETERATLPVKGKELLSQYFHQPRGPVRDAELRFTLPLVNPVTGEVLDLKLRGVIDLVEATGAIVEFKAPQRVAPLSDLPDNLQLTVYSYAYEHLFGKPPTELRKVFLVRTKTPKIEVQTTGRGPVDYERLFHIAAEMLNAIRAGVFIPNRGCWMCGDCEYETDCREWTGNEEVRQSV